MIVTLDTNIIFQGIYSSKGASYQILKLIRHGKVQLALSVPVFMEYCAVLQRETTIEKTGLSKTNINAVLDLLAYVGLEQRIYYLFRPNLIDQSDNKFIELALNSQSKYLITANIKHYVSNNELQIFGVEVIGPGDFMKRWRSKYA